MKYYINSLLQLLHRSKKTILLIVIVSGLTLLLSMLASIWLSSYHNTSFPSFGIIRVIGVEAYGGDIHLSQDGHQYLDWGTLYLGTIANNSFYIKSQSNIPIKLNLTTSNFTFRNNRGENVTIQLPISQPLKITWNYNDTIINPRESVYVTISLALSSDVAFLTYVIDNNVKEFAFDITIKALPSD
ncbi:MAG: hypothetical protein WHU54_08765 [Candidatus Bathyarchaeia archaeon]